MNGTKGLTRISPPLSQRSEYRRLCNTAGAVAGQRGDVRAALRGAAKRFDVEYELPYLAHSPMEPLNCLADVRADGCDLWLGTQMQGPDRDAVAQALGLDPSKVTVHSQFLGGGFGRRANRFLRGRGGRGAGLEGRG